MPITVSGTGITFNDQTTQNTAGAVASDLTAIKTIISPHIGRWAWGHSTWAYGYYGGDQIQRGRYYISRQIYGTTDGRDNYGNRTGTNNVTALYYPGNNIANSYDTATYTNTSLTRSVNVQIQLNIGRSTDDSTNSIVYRGGSIANNYTHSGGTLLYTTGGNSATLSVYTETIPANTTYTYYHYCGVTGGSGGDGCTAWMNLVFLSFN